MGSLFDIYIYTIRRKHIASLCNYVVRFYLGLNKFKFHTTNFFVRPGAVARGVAARARGLLRHVVNVDT